MGMVMVTVMVRVMVMVRVRPWTTESGLDSTGLDLGLCLGPRR